MTDDLAHDGGIAEWETPPGATHAEHDGLTVDVAGYEGPLDLLLALARTRKVDLSQISMLELADQYLAFIADAGALRLEIAADYLVMAAWLAFLKSRLLLPPPKSDDIGECAEEMARRLAFRLMRLDAMRQAAARLMARKRLGIDVFPRGLPEGVRTIRSTRYTASLYDVLTAYGEHMTRVVPVRHVVKARLVWSIQEARRRLIRLMGEDAVSWLALDAFFARYAPEVPDGRTVLASALGATLELAREGHLDLVQERPFGPIHVRARQEEADLEDQRRAAPEAALDVS